MKLKCSFCGKEFTTQEEMLKHFGDKVDEEFRNLTNCGGTRN